MKRLNMGLVRGERSFAAADQNDFAIEQITQNVVVQADFVGAVDLVVHGHDPW